MFEDFNWLSILSFIFNQGQFMFGLIPHFIFLVTKLFNNWFIYFAYNAINWFLLLLLDSVMLLSYYFGVLGMRHLLHPMVRFTVLYSVRPNINEWLVQTIIIRNTKAKAIYKQKQEITNKQRDKHFKNKGQWKVMARCQRSRAREIKQTSKGHQRYKLSKINDAKVKQNE